MAEKRRGFVATGRRLPRARHRRHMRPRGSCSRAAAWAGFDFSRPPGQQSPQQSPRQAAARSPQHAARSTQLAPDGRRPCCGAAQVPFSHRSFRAPSRGLACDVSRARDAVRHRPFAGMRGTWAKPGEAGRPNGFRKDDGSLRGDQDGGVLSDRESQTATTPAARREGWAVVMSPAATDSAPLQRRNLRARDSPALSGDVSRPSRPSRSPHRPICGPTSHVSRLAHQPLVMSALS